MMSSQTADATSGETSGEGRDWRIFRANQAPHDGIDNLPDLPVWRDTGPSSQERLASAVEIGEEQVEFINAALYLRRPLLVTGHPGTGKTTLARAIAHQLKLGPVLKWPITTKSTLEDGLYSYDAIGRLQDASLAKDSGRPIDPTAIAKYLQLGPLGTAFLGGPAGRGGKPRPRVLLIDEIDKSDVDLPHNLLHVFEEGLFRIPELKRLLPDYPVVDGIGTSDGDTRVKIINGEVRWEAFPVVILTSNSEREFPPAFRRRCIQMDMPMPTRDQLERMISNYLDQDPRSAELQEILGRFLERTEQETLATDQLLNALYLAKQGTNPLDRKALLDGLWRALNP